VTVTLISRGFTLQPSRLRDKGKEKSAGR
jgi:hypothetical protein